MLYVSLFTIGHSVTLLVGALGGIRANPYIVDAIIGLSIVYKGFENIGGFKRCSASSRTRARGPHLRPLPRIRSRDQAAGFRALARTGWSTNIVSFNVGVEIGRSWR